MSAQSIYYNFKFVKISAPLAAVILTIPLLFSCGNSEDLEKTINEKVEADKMTMPQSMKINSNQAQSASELAAEMYTMGCLKPGEKSPLVKVHPQFKEGLNYLIRQQKSKNNLEFTIRYDLNSKKVKQEQNNEIEFEGKVLNAEMTGYNGVIISDPKKAVSKKCISSNPNNTNGGTEICYDLETKYSAKFLEFYNTIYQKPPRGCKLETVVDSKTEEFFKGEYTLQNSKKIPSFLKVAKSNLVLKCEDEVVRKFIRVEQVITSNSVIANTLDYCGGTILYRSKIERDSETGMKESTEAFEILLAPTI
jgi:hypothetical protein